MITIYKYYLNTDHIHTKSRNAHVLEFLSVQVQRDEVTLWALVDTEKPANYADIYIIGTGWNLGAKREPWMTKANFVDTVQDQDGLVWHIFGVLPEDNKEEKATERQQVQEQKVIDKAAMEMSPVPNETKEYIEKQYAKEFVKGYIKLLSEFFEEDLTKEFEDLDATINETIERAYRDFKENGACKSDAKNIVGDRNTCDNATTKGSTIDFNESEAYKIIKNFIEKTEQDY